MCVHAPSARLMPASSTFVHWASARKKGLVLKLERAR
jgi:hypothetical protein